MTKSQVITSGFSSAAMASASSPSRAIPTTSMKGLRERISRTTFRTNAESSTMSVRIKPPERGGLDSDINKSVSDFPQFKISSQFEQRFGSAHEQIALGRHARRERCERLADGVRRKINKHVAAEH